ncbi:hypothetical protein AQUCO_00200964v1 [Aquilegia coerulea]|uniref:SGNH hydrolase-type esterase domain-containing protein n=1 Tax=Aquilegia coerulea TaxID=218851 RepID=A0A2G5F5T4_AQUCA|nr:hypothetical protein AQUCO_00200964v1 [Aquilegia coerulea]
MTSSTLWLLVLSIFSHLYSTRSIKAVAPALFVFGDSLLDSRNNNFLVTLARADFPPYGVDFSGGATAQLLGLPFAPPYTSHEILKNLTGVNYASGASGILPETGSNLALTLNNLADSLRGSVFIHGQTNTLVKNMIVNPFKYGFVDTKNPCCVAGDATLACTPNLPPCLNDNQYLWWDGYHLTEAAYFIVARVCFSGSSVCSPLNINQLVQN